MTAVLLSLLMQPALACDPPTPRLVETLPADGVRQVPRDARVAVHFEGDIGDSLDLFLSSGTENVPVDVGTSTPVGDGPADIHKWAFVSPLVELQPGLTYTLYWPLEAAPGGVLELTTFTVGDSTSLPPQPPTMQIVGRGELMQGADSCEFAQHRDTTFQIDVPEADGLGLVHIFRDGGDGAEAPDPGAYRTYALAPGYHELTPTLTLDAATEPDWCFWARTENAAGVWSPPSDPTCVSAFEADPTDPDSGEGEGHGCSAVPLTSLPSWLLGGLALVGLRRRR